MSAQAGDVVDRIRKTGGLRVPCLVPRQDGRRMIGPGRGDVWPRGTSEHGVARPAQDSDDPRVQKLLGEVRARIAKNRAF